MKPVFVKKYLISLFCATSLLPSAIYAANHVPESVKKVLDSTIQPVMAEQKIPGMAVAVTMGGKSWVVNYGVTSKESQQPVTGSTLFELGSISKTFTATLAAWAQANKRLSLTEPVETYLPVLKGSQFGQVPLFHLATHTAGGLPLQVPDDLKTEAQLMDYFKQWQPEYALGAYRTYANPSIGTLGLIAAKSMGQDFTVLVEQHLFPALGIKNSFINVPRQKMTDYAQGYTAEDKPIRLAAGLLSSEAYGVKATASDMIHFVEANMGLYKLDSRLQQALATTHTGYFKLDGMTQSLIWEQYTYPVALKTLLAGNSADIIFNATPVSVINPPLKPQQNVWINKTGSTNGFSAYVAYIPQKKLGIVILANKSFAIADRVKIAYNVLTSLDNHVN